MNGITGASAQNTGTGPTPYTPAEAADLKATGFGFSEKGVTWDQWIDTARTSQNPDTRAQLRELIDLAGGRTDNAAIKVAMERYQAMQHAASPTATAADKQAALKGMEVQLTTAFDRMGLKDKLTEPLEGATKSLLNDPIYANTDWGKALKGAVDLQKNSLAFQWGLAQGVYEGGKSLVVGVVSLAGKALQYGADNTVAGQAGDALRGLTGKMPGWLDAVIPSSKRGDASTDALVAMGKGIDTYLSSHTPAEAAADIGNAIGKAWDGLKADHAAARAKGPDAEAEWWGKTIGRIGFEVGATFVPVAGVAGKLSGGARVADAAVDGARVIGSLANDAARVTAKSADLGSDLVRIGDKGADGIRKSNNALEATRAGNNRPANPLIYDSQGTKNAVETAGAASRNSGVNRANVEAVLNNPSLLTPTQVARKSEINQTNTLVDSDIAPNKTPSLRSNVLSEASEISSELGEVKGTYTGLVSVGEKGPLPNNLVGTFSGGRYDVVTLAEDTILYRAGVADKPLGQFFSKIEPSGVLQTRIDQAVLPVWPDGGISPLDTAFAIKIPSGTEVYVGKIGTQGGLYSGGADQILVIKPWMIEGVEVLGAKPIQ